MPPRIIFEKIGRIAPEEVIFALIKSKCLCPNSITSILLKTCLKPGFRQVLSRKKVGDQSWSPTCLRPGLRQVVRQVVPQVVRQDRSNGIWALPIFFYGAEACHTNSAVRHSLDFAFNKVLFKIFGALSKVGWLCKV